MEPMKLLGEGRFYEMQVYQGNLQEEAVPYVGAIRHHYHPNMVFLLPDPLDHHGIVYEFRMEDILYAEEVTHLTREDGLSIERIKIWVRQESLAMKIQPFYVGEDS